MQDERARRRVSDLMARLDLDPVIGEAPHDLSRLLLVSARENVVASTSWDDRRRVPELHRPLSRSSRRAFSTAPAGSAGRGIFQNPFGSLPEPRRTSPVRARRWAGTTAWSRLIGTIFAIGFPRSVTITSSPALTRARCSLKVALSLDTVALRISCLL